MRAIGRSTGGQPVRGQPIGRVHQDTQNNDWQMVVYKPAGPPIAHRRPAFIVVVDVLAGARALLTPSLLTPSPLQVCSPGPFPSALSTQCSWALLQTLPVTLCPSHLMLCLSLTHPPFLQYLSSVVCCLVTCAAVHNSWSS